MADNINAFDVEICGRKYPLKKIKASEEYIIRCAEKEIKESIDKIKAKNPTKDDIDSLAITALNAMVRLKVEQGKSTEDSTLSDTLVKTIDMLDDILSGE